jgi:hypothetical protein
MGVVNDHQGGHIDLIVGRHINEAGEAIEYPLCPYCNTEVDAIRLTDDIMEEDPYPVVQCEACGKDVAYADWVGTQYPIRSNLTLSLTSWFFPYEPAEQPMVDEISAATGGRWRYSWSHH